MEKGLNFKSLDSQKEYFAAYDESLKLVCCPISERYIMTSYGKSHVLCSGNENNPPLVLLHAASCGSTIWYKNLPFWSAHFCVYAIDLIGESSKSILTKKMKTTYDNALWLNETITGLGLERINLCGLSIGGWNAANYASYFPQSVIKLVLLSPVQTLAKMHLSFFFKIMKMGFHPTRENVENYIGWGSEKEEPLPDSIIQQFTISVLNMNANASFPKWLKKKQLLALHMPVLVLLGENEFAFSIQKASKRAHDFMDTLDIEVIKGASHLLSVSNDNDTNERVRCFIQNGECNQ